MAESDRTPASKATPLAGIAAGAAALMLFAGCATRAPVEPAPAAEESRAAEVDRSTAAEYRVDPDESLLQLYVYRAGALARLGHNHVIASRDLEGTIWYRDRRGRSAFRIRLPVKELTVDEPGLREAAGEAFSGEIPPEDIEATRRNLLGEEVLHGERYPELTAELVALEGDGETLTATTAVTIRGQRRLVDLPVQLRLDDERLVATGETEVSHAALGIEPFSVMGGALSVAEEIGISYRIVARRR